MAHTFKRIEFKPLYAGEKRTHTSGVVGAIAGRSNDILMFKNPDRGYRTTMPLRMFDTHPDPEDPSKACPFCDLIIRGEDGKVKMNPNSKCRGKHDVRECYGNLDNETNAKVLDYMFDLIYFNNGKTDYDPKLILLQAGFKDCGKKEKLPQYIFDCLQMFFDRCRMRGVKVLFRTGYHSVQYNWQESEEWKAMHEAVGADEETMISHIKQLAPLLKRNGDILHKMSSGFIGSGGEMAYCYQYPTVNYDRIIKTVIEEICIPLGIYYTSRMPEYRINLINNDPDYKYKHLIGLNNDAMYGENENYGWQSGCWQYNHNFDTVKGEHKCFEADNGGVHIKNDWWNYACEIGAYTPQSGEMFHTGSTFGRKILPTGFDIIKQTAHHRFTSMSQWNSYIENSTYKDEAGVEYAADSVMQRWIENEVVTPEWLDSEGIVYDPFWFTGENGNLVHRNPYEFIRDHLGYRISLDAFEYTGKIAMGESLNLKLGLKNYGFAAAFNMRSGFAVLDEGYNPVCRFPAGDPEKWYSHSAEEWRSDEVLTHSLEADIKLPFEEGKYYLAFYLQNSSGEGARTANDIEFKNGFNILCEVELM